MKNHDYEAEARAKLAQCDGKIKLRLSDTLPAPWNDKDDRYRPHYKFTLKGPGGSYTSDFWDSIRSGEEGREAGAYDVLSCLCWDCPEQFEDFCAEFGESEDSRRAHQCWCSQKSQTAALRRIFPDPKAREILSSIR